MNTNRLLGVVIMLLALPPLLASLSGAPNYGPWSTPVNLGFPVNTTFNETAPTLSKNGRSLYFTSNRPCGSDDATLDLNIWVLQRQETSGPWSAPECLAINVDGFEDSAPAFSRDAHWMFFVSDRPGSFGTPGFNGRDIWITWRAHVHDDQDWDEPFNGGSLINTDFAEAGPSYFENEGGIPQLFLTSNRDGTFDIWVSDVLGSGVLDVPRRVDELNTELVEARPSIRHDGLEIFFFRGATVFDVFAATRPTPTAPWGEALNLGEPVSGPFNDQQASIASDRRTLYFASNRLGSLGNNDIWVTTREKSSNHK
jgi:Tol biopolymer transport system component